MKAEKAAGKRVPFSRSAKTRLRTRKKPLSADEKALLAAFGQVLTRLQKRCKLSDEQFAKKSRIPAKRIQAIATGDKEPYLDELFHLASALGLKPSEFLKRVYRAKNASKALQRITLV